MWFASCQLKCKVDTKNASRRETLCTANYVDCSLNGGYDPRDPCKQKCVTPLGGRKTATAGDTLPSEVTTSTTSIIHKGEKIEVDCTMKDTIQNKGLKCYDKEGYMIKFNEDPNAKDKLLYKKALPEGEEWVYDCNFLENLLYDNCFESKSSAMKIVSGIISFSALIFFMGE